MSVCLDALQCVSRVYVLLNGLEFHCYNASSTYRDIDQSFKPPGDIATDSAENSGSGDKRSDNSPPSIKFVLFRTSTGKNEQELFEKKKGRMAN